MSTRMTHVRMMRARKRLETVMLGIAVFIGRAERSGEDMYAL